MKRARRFPYWRTKGKRTTVFAMLNIVCIMAMCVPADCAVIGPGVTKSTNAMKGLRTTATQRVPTMLNRMCAHAALFAFVFAPSETRNESKVVPMFAPRVIAAAISKLRMPFAARPMTIASVALEALINMVNTVPTRTQRMIASHPLLAKSLRKRSASPEGSGIALERYSSPRKIRAKPISPSP